MLGARLICTCKVFESLRLSICVYKVCSLSKGNLFRPYTNLDGLLRKKKLFGSRIETMQCVVTKSLHNLSFTQTLIYWVYWSDRIEKPKND